MRALEGPNPETGNRVVGAKGWGRAMGIDG